jgi:hypothetical protein
MSEYLPTTRENKPKEEFLWIIEAQHDFLDRFCLVVGLDRDSAVPLIFTLKPDRFAPARLTFPSARCPRPEPWLKVLGLLYLRHTPFKLYQATGQEDALTSLTQLSPAIDRELGELLGLAAKGKIGQLRNFSQMLEKVFARLQSLTVNGIKY